jgi:hypothetical protein
MASPHGLTQLRLCTSLHVGTVLEEGTERLRREDPSSVRLTCPIVPIYLFSLVEHVDFVRDNGPVEPVNQLFSPFMAAGLPEVRVDLHACSTKSGHVHETDREREREREHASEREREKEKEKERERGCCVRETWER